MNHKHMLPGKGDDIAKKQSVQYTNSQHQQWTFLQCYFHDLDIVSTALLTTDILQPQKQPTVYLHQHICLRELKKCNKLMFGNSPLFEKAHTCSTKSF